jgi:hypothetical protein
MAIVYQHRRKDTNEVFYIGIGENKKRAYSYGRNPYWNKIVDKYGYEVDILFEGVSWEDACEIEKGLIKDYGRYDLGLGNLVNMTDGGEGTLGRIVHKHTISKWKNNYIGKYTGENSSQYGKILSQETKDKISKTNKVLFLGEKNPMYGIKLIGENNGMFGKKHSPEAIEKIKKSKTGENNSIYGKVWINDGNKQKYIEKSNIEEFKSNGWILGRLNDTTEKIKQKIKGFKYNQVTCNKCGKIGSGPNMKRYHFENCKI